MRVLRGAGSDGVGEVGEEGGEIGAARGRVGVVGGDCVGGGGGDGVFDCVGADGRLVWYVVEEGGGLEDLEGGGREWAYCRRTPWWGVRG